MAFYRRLGELLLAAGTITQEQLDRGLALQKEQKGRLGEVLIEDGFITDDVMALETAGEVYDYLMKNVAK